MADRPVLLRLRVLAWRARSLGWLLVLAGTVGAVVHLATPPRESVPVVVLARGVPAGQALVAADLAVARLPVGLAPDGAHRGLADLVGRAPVVDLSPGLPLVDGLLGGERFTLEPPPGAAVVAVSLTASELLRVGDRVDLVAGASWTSSDEPAEPLVLATSALVLDVGTAAGSDGDLLGAETERPSVLVAVSPAEGRRIAATWDGQPLGAVLVG